MKLNDWYSQGKNYTVNGLDVFARVEGSGPALLCIHGFPTSSLDFAPIWAELTAKFQVIAYDLIGLGRSAKPKQPISVSLQADMAEGLLQQLGIREAHILAHDLGDTVAQEILARHKEKSSPVHWLSCIFLNGGIFPEVHRPRTIQKLLISPIGGLIAQFSSESTLKKTMHDIFSKEHPPSETFIKESWQLMTENGGKSMIPRLIRYMAERKTYRSRWVKPLEEADVPLRLINGVQDPVSGRHLADRFAEIVPNADIVYLEEAGHYPHVEVPAQVLTAIWDFYQAM